MGGIFVKIDKLYSVLLREIGGKARQGLLSFVTSFDAAGASFTNCGKLCRLWWQIQIQTFHFLLVMMCKFQILLVMV